MSSTAERTNGVFDALNAGYDLVAVSDVRAVRHPHSQLFGPNEVQTLTSRGFVQVFDTLEDLAKSLDIPFSALDRERTLYNDAVDEAQSSGRERPVFDHMGRRVVPEAERMEEGPWYAAPLLAKVLLCGGGVAIDLKARVLSVADDRPIQGLFAAGEITGGLWGSGDVGSCGLLDAITFGRIAGKEAAALEKDYSDWRTMSPLYSRGGRP